jgi:hypothetical protein
VALSRIKPDTKNRLERFRITRKEFDRFTVARNKVRRKLHLSLEYPEFLSAACRSWDAS